MLKWGCSNTSLFILSGILSGMNGENFQEEKMSESFRTCIHIRDIKITKERLFCKIQEKKSISRLYCITLPLWNSAFLEIYPYNELLSDIHEGKRYHDRRESGERNEMMQLLLLRRMIDDHVSVKENLRMNNIFLWGR